MLNTLIFFSVLLLVSAIFSGTETAFTSISEIRLAGHRRKNTRKIRIARELLRKKGPVISAILVGNNVVNTLLAVYAGAFFNQIFVETGALSATTGPIAASLITVVFLLVFGEVIPKHIAVTFARTWTIAMAWPLYALVKICRPITLAMETLSKCMMSLLPKTSANDDAPTIDELLLWAKVSEKAGHIDSVEHKLMSKSSNFNDLQACDVMVPRNNVKGVKVDLNLEDLKERFREDLYTRVPVYGKDLDEILGILNFKELLKLTPKSEKKFKINKVMLPALFVPENVPIGELLERMKENRRHMVIVVDEHGSTAGIITMEDIIERLFGLISDEYDIDSDHSVRRHENGDMEASGNSSLQELATVLKIEFPEDIRKQANTLSGFLTYLKGDFLKTKDKFAYKNHIFVITRIDGHVAENVLIKKKETINH